MRTALISGRMDRIPADKKEYAEKLYQILDEIEWNRAKPFYWGFFIAVIGGIITGMSIKDERQFIYGYIIAIIIYVISVIFLNRFVLSDSCHQKVAKLRSLFLINQNYIDTLELITRLDPNITRGCRKYIRQALFLATE